MKQRQMRLTKEVSQRLRELRHSYDFTQQFVADTIGVSRSTYAGYEKNTIPDTFALVRLARLYAISTDTLLFGSRDKLNVPSEFIEITSNLTSQNREMFWTHLLEYAKYLSDK